MQTIYFERPPCDEELEKIVENPEYYPIDYAKFENEVEKNCPCSTHSGSHQQKSENKYIQNSYKPSLLNEERNIETKSNYYNQKKQNKKVRISLM